MNVTIPEAFGLSLLGMAVVFMVLVFLMCIIYIMSSIVKVAGKRREKKSEISGSGG